MDAIALSAATVGELRALLDLIEPQVRLFAADSEAPMIVLHYSGWRLEYIELGEPV